MKSLLNVYIHELGVYWQAENTPAGIKKLVTKIKRYQLMRVLVEAAGGCERTIAEAGVEHDLAVIIVAPVQVRQPVKAPGILAKTDKLQRCAVWLRSTKTVAG